MTERATSSRAREFCGDALVDRRLLVDAECRDQIAVACGVFEPVEGGRAPLGAAVGTASRPQARCSQFQSRCENATRLFNDLDQSVSKRALP